MSKIVFLGDEDLISGLRSLGFDTLVFKDERSQEISEKILSEGYALCFVQEDYFFKLEALYLKVQEKPFPIILPFPTHFSSQGLGKELLKKIILRATGAQEILKDERGKDN
ncbi:MAG: hypothetical protein NC912_03260 [Candidatus Omnitrophica bacterium]|nr:hypothetical protein [Candidatus Omnitrophota bacterium]